MSTRGLKKNSNYLERTPKTENEPEEGEIVDDYDLIVSSDEELCMMQRIRELEAENEEIEQIAVISRSYVDKINHSHQLDSSRAAQLPADVSSISSTEFITPKKRKRRKSREHKRKHCHRLRTQHGFEQPLRHSVHQLPVKNRSKKSHCKRREKLFGNKYNKIHSERSIQKEINTEYLSVEVQESSESSPFTDTENYSCNSLISKRKEQSFNKRKYITRDTLRLAVARNTDKSILSSKKYCLKDKLLRQELVGQSLNNTITDRYSVVQDLAVGEDNNDEDDDVQVIENEPDIQTVDEDSTDSMEEKELRLIALKSAVLKKHKARKERNAEAAYSPTDFDEMLSSGMLQQDKLDPIEVVDLEAEDSQTACFTDSPEASPQLMILDDEDESQQIVDCKPVDMEIANSDSEDAEIVSWSKQCETSFSKYPDFYMQSLLDLPPPPPGVDDYQDLPPPPPMLYINANQDMDLDNEVFSENHNTREINTNAVGDERSQYQKAASFSNPECIDNDDEAEDEEEEALRALLLSKFQSPKNQKKCRSPKEPIEYKDAITINERNEQDQCKAKPTEFILKEAVKRLKVHSKNELLKEEARVDSHIRYNPRIEGKIQEYQENKSFSPNCLEKLRNSSNIHRNQSIDQFKGAIGKCISEQNEIGLDFYERTSNEYIDTTSTIDISDITRRLEKIKENVLNLNSNNSCKDIASSLNTYNPQVVDQGRPHREIAEVTDDLEECKKMLVQNVIQGNQLLPNSIAKKMPANNNSSDNIVTQNTGVKTNCDIGSNQSTFKVTIINTAFNSGESHITNSLTEKNVPKKLTLKTNANAKCKTSLNSEKIIKITNRTNNSKTESNAKSNKLLTGATSNVKYIKNTAAAIKSSLRSKKIIKPNKVINANFDLHIKPISQLTDSKAEMSSQLTNHSENSRLITSLDQVKHMCKVNSVVISLQNSSNESSEGELHADYHSLYKPLYDYNDNASPLSLILESPSRTPLQSNSPTDRGTEFNVVQMHLEEFNLKSKRNFTNKENVTSETPSNSAIDQEEKLNKQTPLAVRHLPVAAQREYRRLVHRMKLLENKRKIMTIEADSVSGAEHTGKDRDNNDSTNSVLKTSLVKKVLLKNASNNTTSSAGSITSMQITNGSLNSAKNKTNVLRSYENLYIKFGAGIVKNLDKSLKLVEEAKKAKLAKLKLENRLKELKAEMEILQDKHKEEQQKISRIYPHICTTNEDITSLKQKRSKLFKAALNLGRTLNGEEYRLKNDLKKIITTKSNKLASEIKYVNSLKTQDISNIDVIVKPETHKENNSDNKANYIEDRLADGKAKNNIEIIKHLNGTTNTNTWSCLKKCDADEEKNDLQPILKTEVGGNSENLDQNDAESYENSMDVDQHYMETKLNNSCLEKCSEKISLLTSYISPLEHLRNIDSNVDPNGVVCPFDLMGNCEDVTCKYIHLTPKTKM